MNNPNPREATIEPSELRTALLILAGKVAVFILRVLFCLALMYIGYWIGKTQ